MKWAICKHAGAILLWKVESAWGRRCRGSWLLVRLTCSSIAKWYWHCPQSTVDGAEEESDRWAKVLCLGELYTTPGHLEMVVNFHAGAGPVWMDSGSWAAPLGHSAGRTAPADALCFSAAVLCASQHRQNSFICDLFKFEIWPLIFVGETRKCEVHALWSACFSSPPE